MGLGAEAARVVRDAVDDQERHAVAVADVRRFDAAHDQLQEVPRADPRAEVTLQAGRVPCEVRDVDFPGRTDPHLDDLK